MSGSTLCSRWVIIVAALLPADICLGSDILAAARAYPDGGGYQWTPGNSGTPIDVDFAGERILAKGDGTICCGFTLAVAIEVADHRGLLDGKPVEDVRAFQRHWYGSTDVSKDTLCVYAVEKLRIGKAVSLEDAQPGDFVQFWRTSGSGHSVILLDLIRDGESIVGIKYRSSQKSTDGIGDRVEYFADAPGRTGLVMRSRTHVCRLNESSSPNAASSERQIAEFVAEGAFAEAEERLKTKITDPSAPVTDDTAIQLELLRRIRYDFPLSTEQVLAQIQESVPDATLEDVTRWRDAGGLDYRVIDGRVRYFRRAASNLFRFNRQASRRRTQQPKSDRFDLTKHIAKLVRVSETAEGPDVFPVRHTIHYELAVKLDHPRLRPGAIFRAWLPFPQEYRQQRDVRLIRSEPKGGIITENGRPHRTIYFEQTIANSSQPPRCAVEFEFVTSAWCPKLDPAAVEPYDTSSDLYRDYTAERPPHVVFTPDVISLAREIVGKEDNPLERARRIFRWVSKNVSWCAEMEYSIIPNLSAKGLAARRGDCGVQGLVFITLCRAAGVPARWQSGWQTQPGNWNMHDWSEFYVAPWGWLPADASKGIQESTDPRVRDFLCGHMDPYRMIVNLDYGRPLQPPKTSFRSEPNDFQRGEVEIDGHNLYFDEWDWKFEVRTTPLNESSR